MKDKNKKLTDILYEVWKNSRGISEEDKIYLKDHYLTVNDLLEICKKEIENGHGDSHVFVEEYYMLNGYSFEKGSNDVCFHAIQINDDIDIFGKL